MPTIDEAELAALRARSEDAQRRLRLEAASKALAACGLSHLADGLDSPTLLNIARGHVQALRLSLRSGSDEPRYAATGAALSALGALWAVS